MTSGWLRPVVLTMLLLAGARCHAQGCSVCRDATAGSAPQVRRSLRYAIPVLGLPAVGVFAGALLLMRRIRPGTTRG